MKYKIIKGKNKPVLKQISEQVRSFDSSLERLANDMITVMRSTGLCGLAAPQIGISKRIVVAKSYNYGFFPKTYVLVNPEMVKKKGTFYFPEMCLSLPFRIRLVKRSFYVKVKAQNVKGEEVYLRKLGINATVLQHELDHLEGILLTDYNFLGQRKKKHSY